MHTLTRTRTPHIHARAPLTAHCLLHATNTLVKTFCSFSLCDAVRCLHARAGVRAARTCHNSSARRKCVGGVSELVSAPAAKSLANRVMPAGVWSACRRKYLSSRTIVCVRARVGKVSQLVRLHTTHKCMLQTSCEAAARARSWEHRECARSEAPISARHSVHANENAENTSSHKYSSMRTVGPLTNLRWPQQEHQILARQTLPTSGWIWGPTLRRTNS